MNRSVWVGAGCCLCGVQVSGKTGERRGADKGRNGPLDSRTPSPSLWDSAQDRLTSSRTQRRARCEGWQRLYQPYGAGGHGDR